MGLAGLLLSGVIGHVLGQRAERNKQSLLIRAEMLKPIDQWLKGVEKLVGILSDTIVSITLKMPAPVSYDFDERRKTSNFMAEKTNEILGILASKSLQTKKTVSLAKELGDVISALDTLVKFQLLPRESDIVERSKRGALTEDVILEAGSLKLYLDSLLQKAHSLVAKIRTMLM